MKSRLNFQLALFSLILFVLLLAYPLFSHAARGSLEATLMPKTMTWKTCYFLTIQQTSQDSLVKMVKKDHSFWPLRSQFCDSSSFFTSTNSQPVELIGDYSQTMSEGSTFTFWFLPAPQFLSQDLFQSKPSSQSYLIENGTWIEKENQDEK